MAFIKLIWMNFIQMLKILSKASFFLVCFLMIFNRSKVCSFDNAASDDHRFSKEKPSSPVMVISETMPDDTNKFKSDFARSQELYKHLSKGDSFLKARLYSEAESEYNVLINGIDGKKDSWMGHVGLLQLYESKNDFNKAIRECQWVISHSADFAKTKYESRMEKLKLLAAKSQSLQNQPAQSS